MEVKEKETLKNAINMYQDWKHMRLLSDQSISFPNDLPIWTCFSFLCTNLHLHCTCSLPSCCMTRLRHCICSRKA